MSRLDSRHLVDPQLLPLIDVFPTLELTTEMLPALRAMEVPMALGDGSGTEVNLDKRSAPGPAGAPAIGLTVYRPPGEGVRPCIFHVHGGGFVGGSSAQFEPILRPISAELGCAIVSVDYRLAPETPFPGAIEDCYAGLAWLFAHAGEIGVDQARIGVMGESAGGGLAAALALMARDRGEYSLAFQHLIYPMLDDRTCIAADPHPLAGEFIWTAHNNAFGWSALLGVAPGSEGVSPYAAPARAVELAGLPPAFIATGALDLFLEEDIEYARRLMRCGVPVELHVYPGAFHGFDIAPGAVVSRAAGRHRLESLRRALFPDSETPIG